MTLHLLRPMTQWQWGLYTLLAKEVPVIDTPRFELVPGAPGRWIVLDTYGVAGAVGKLEPNGAWCALGSEWCEGDAPISKHRTMDAAVDAVLETAREARMKAG